VIVATKSGNACYTSIMKTLLILACAATLIGCAATPTTTTTTTTASTSEQASAGPKKVYTSHDLDRSGRATPGAALRTLDPDVTGGGQ
jgi:uncharacterized lipoprotein YajG